MARGVLYFGGNVLDVWFEKAETPQVFAHIRSTTGIFGHAAEFKAKVPSGAWICVQPKHHPAVTWWLIRHGECDWQGRILVGGELNELLRRR